MFTSLVTWAARMPPTNPQVPARRSALRHCHGEYRRAGEVPTDVGDELDYLIDIARARASAPEYP